MHDPANETIRYAVRTPPVLLLTFSRPLHAARVLERIQEARPSALYVACDGPRVGRDDDLANVRAIHEMVDRIDWCANVKTLFRDRNLGCGPAVSQGITWFMEQAGEGIILEDDCLPDPTFFRFCGEMLDRYRNASNVMQVTGYNLIGGRYPTTSDYIFSHFGWQWGWATWRRAWDLFDLAMTTWPRFKELGLHHQFPFTQRRVEKLDATFEGRVETWDYQWAYAMASNSGISVVPRVNLVRNIGFGPGATHTTIADGGREVCNPVEPMSFPLRHCAFLYADKNYDDMLLRTCDRQSLIGAVRSSISLARRRLMAQWTRVMKMD